MRAAWQQLRTLEVRLRWFLPSGGTLNRTEWRQRQMVLQWIIGFHGVALFAIGMYVGNGLVHSLADAAVLLPWMVLAWAPRLPRRLRSCAASIALLTASAVLVHLFNGAIEAHFHFFVVIAIIALYQDWVPFGVTLLFVVFEHGIGGLLVPGAV